MGETSPRPPEMPPLAGAALAQAQSEAAAEKAADEPPAFTPWQELEMRLELFFAKHQESQEFWSHLFQEQTQLFTEMRCLVREQAEARTTCNLASPRHALSVLSGNSEGAPSHERFRSEDSSKEIPMVELRDYHCTTAGNLSRTSLLSTGSQTCKCVLPSCREGFWKYLQGVCTLILHWRYFELVMGIMIALNAINIGWTIDLELKGQAPEAQDFFETCFLGVFIMEISMRLISKGVACLWVPANIFDLVLVVVTSITPILTPILEASDSTNNSFLQQVMILRMMRLLRLARAVRLVATFRPLWKLAKGLADCCSTMFSALVLMFITIYVFACFGAEFIAKLHKDDPDPEIAALIAMDFSTLPKILLTLMRFTTMDSTHSFYGPLVYRSPGLVVYFLLLFVVITIAMMNLITALLVEDALNSAKMDQEMRMVYSREKIKYLKPALRQLFHNLDTSGDGIINVKEVVDAVRMGISIPTELHDVVNPARMLDLFEALDADQSGDLTEAEFVDGLCCVAVTDMPRETMQVLQHLRSMRQEIRKALKGHAGHSIWSGGRSTSFLPGTSTGIHRVTRCAFYNGGTNSPTHCERSSSTWAHHKSISHSELKEVKEYQRAKAAIRNGDHRCQHAEI